MKDNHKRTQKWEWAQLRGKGGGGGRINTHTWLQTCMHASCLDLHVVVHVCNAAYIILYIEYNGILSDIIHMNYFNHLPPVDSVA